MSLKTVSGTLAAAVADSGTFTVSYPARSAPEYGVTDEGDFYLAMGHQFVVNQTVLAFPQDFDITLGTASITVTNRTGATWAAGSSFILGLEEQGKSVWAEGAPGVRMARMARADSFLINLGAPDTADVDGLITAYTGVAAGIALNGALVSGGVGVFDVPRNIVVDAAAADTAVLTFTGFDEYGAAMSEAITLNGATAVQGKKAFKRITGVTASADLANGAFAGPGDILGLPVFLPGTGLSNIINEIADGVAATAGTAVAGIRLANGSTTTSGDVRGTYDPNAACDGAVVFQLIVALPDPGYRGIPQA